MMVYILILDSQKLSDPNHVFFHKSDPRISNDPDPRGCDPNTKSKILISLNTDP